MDYTLDAFTFLESIHFLLITMPLAYEGLQVTDKTVFSIKKNMYCHLPENCHDSYIIYTASDVTNASQIWAPHKVHRNKP